MIKIMYLDLAVPGIDKKDLKIDINEDVLTISSETKNESEENKTDTKEKNSAIQNSAEVSIFLKM
jgi:HSP20 family molecular chaperone IbpA